VLPIVTVSEGRVVADPELRFASTGTAVGKFRVVANSRKKNEQGEWVDDKLLWINVTCFQQLAENVAESIRKGDLVSVTGRLQTDEWETQEGEKRSQTVIIADQVAASLRFRTIRHSEGRVERSQKADPDADPWATTPPKDDEPPF
jgi:single-strand DNA-binding protein